MAICNYIDPVAWALDDGMRIHKYVYAYKVCIYIHIHTCLYIPVYIPLCGRLTMVCIYVFIQTWLYATI